MTPYPSRPIVPLGLLIAALLVGGCAANSAKSKSKQPATKTPPVRADSEPVVSNTDACAAQMHDLCGAFLNYLRTHPTLPASLDELDRSFLPQGEQTFFCPLAKQAYIYRPNGILLPEKNARIILYDAAPAHRGFRMAIRAEEPEDGRAPIMKVVALPESFFLLRPPGSESSVQQRP